MQSISLADELTLGPATGGRVGDELVCPGVPGRPEENLAARALRVFRRRTGWQAPPLRLTVEKRIPLAAGLAGGSADAAAALRLARAASGLGDEALLLDIARGLGADVPAQVEPGRWLASGAGERLERLPPPRDRVRGARAAGRLRALHGRRLRRGRPLGAGARALGAGARCTRSWRRALGAGRRRCPPRASCSTTICSAPPSRCAREIAEALRAARRRRRRARRS